MSNSVPEGYAPKTCESLPPYLEKKLPNNIKLGGTAADWSVKEIGDGNLNLVFIVQGLEKSIIVKQALPYVRAAGESWKLSITRAYFEYNVLDIEAKFAGHSLVPEVYFYDSEMALFAMEYLTDHVILRKELMAGKCFQNLAEDIGLFLAKTLFYTSDIGMNAKDKKALVSKFSVNYELCQITEDLIFTEPYYDAERNNWTSPQLDDDVKRIWQDKEMIQVAMKYKYKFMTECQALLHGDLHSGSIMITDKDTKVIDPEFGFMGPMAFDIGNYMGNLFFAYFARPGWEPDTEKCTKYQEWLFEQMEITWQVFVDNFKHLWINKEQGDAYSVELFQMKGKFDALEDAQNDFMATLLEDTLVNAGLEINRRIIGFAGVADFNELSDQDERANYERKALRLARELILNAKNYQDFASVKFYAEQC